MEEQLFSWKAWDELEYPGFLQFYDCQLKDNIFPQLKERFYPTAYINFETGDLVLHNEKNEEVFTTKLKLVEA